MINKDGRGGRVHDGGMVDGVTRPPDPVNEPVRTYAPGSKERASLEARLKELTAADPVDLVMTVGGEQRTGAGEVIDVVMPHRHAQVLGRTWNATAPEVEAAIDAAL